jgi:hypothetical protein
MALLRIPFGSACRNDALEKRYFPNFDGVLVKRGFAATGRLPTDPAGRRAQVQHARSLRDFSIAETDHGHWMAWGRLFDAVKTGERAAPKALGKEIFEWYEEHPQEAAVFGGAMSNLAAMVAGEVASICDFSKAKKIVDIGGSHGTLLAAVLKRNLGTFGIVIDLPNVADRARQALQGNGLDGRAEAIGGDFFVDVPEFEKR